MADTSETSGGDNIRLTLSIHLSLKSEDRKSPILLSEFCLLLQLLAREHPIRTHC
jgi:hypothetical protein